MPEERTFPIKITPHQREALISCTRLKAAIKRRLKEADDGPQVIEFTKGEIDDLLDELGQAAVYALSPYKKRILAVQKKAHDINEQLQMEAFGITPAKSRFAAPSRRRPASPGDVLPESTNESENTLLFQFKTTLLEVEPPIWRRIQTTDGTLGELHDLIQAAMGWEDCHLHQFHLDGVRYGPTLPDDLDDELEDEDGVLLSEVLPKNGKRHRFEYVYDFGDYWRHEVVFEGYPPIDEREKYPLCLEGLRACPPEDVGGSWGYAVYLEAIADPSHDEHAAFMEWRGPFDPEKFEAKKATREMRKMFR